MQYFYLTILLGFPSMKKSEARFITSLEEIVLIRKNQINENMITTKICLKTIFSHLNQRTKMIHVQNLEKFR